LYHDSLCKICPFFQFPSSEEEWIDIAKEFESWWNFHNCLGAVDGKYVAIILPPGGGSFFSYRYKGFRSLVLMGIANANYEFILVDFGTNGHISDGGVIENTDFYDKLKNKSSSIPNPDSELNETKLLYVFVGDEAFS
jgi:hypothetical protein